MYSAAVCKEEILEIRKLIRGKDPVLVKALDRCNKYLLTLKRECESGYRRLEQAGGFVLPMQQLSGELDRYLNNPWKKNRRRNCWNSIFRYRIS